MERVGYIVTSIFVIAIILYFTLQPQPVATCTGSFLNQEMSAADVKKSCPGVSREYLIKALVDAKNLTNQERDLLLVDITNNY